MRFRFKPTAEQRAALQIQLARLQEPAPVLELLRPNLPADFQPAGVSCTVHGVHSDRFVVRAQVRSTAGDERAFALKVYSDDFGERVWAHAQALAAHHRPNRDGLCLPIRYLPHERVLVFPWVGGRPLSEVVDGRTPALLRRAARLAADLHRLAIVPEPPTTAQMIVDETRARCDRLRSRWPEMAPVVEPLTDTLQEAVAFLEPAALAPIHGDMWAGQFVEAGDRVVLLDLDMFGYADPAYDAGYFLAQLERRCLSDATLPPCAHEWPACFRDAYLAAMPTVSPGNMSFYRGLTLVRKLYTVCRVQAPGWRTLVRGLADRARVALEAVPTVGQTT
jgi:hypothetical protein